MGEPVKVEEQHMDQASPNVNEKEANAQGEDYDEESWDDDDDDLWTPWPDEGKAVRSSGGNSDLTGQAGRQAHLQRLQTRVNFDSMPRASSMSQSAKNSIVNSEKKANTSRNLGLTQDTRATVQQVLDPRTMLVLSKFMKRGLFDEIHGCISTGKEANVYYATTKDGLERAVKVYKTSILVFKDRARYVEGEFRFRNGYCKGNPRKMVAQWAEKEMRNLKRLQAAGIACPTVVEVRQNVLVMEFIGEDGNAAPRLTNVLDVDPDDWAILYRTCVHLMRRMMQECKLVHGDLSDFNILYHEGSLVIIDVSQSVENDHPQALDFLKRDCLNVNNFFAKRMQRRPIAVRRFFDFVATRELANIPNLHLEGPLDDEKVLDELIAQSVTAPEDDDDEVFVQTWIPSRLDQVSDRATMEKEMERRDKGDDMLYARLLAEGIGSSIKTAAEGLDEGNEDAESEEVESDEPQQEKKGKKQQKDSKQPSRKEKKVEQEGEEGSQKEKKVKQEGEEGSDTESSDSGSDDEGEGPHVNGRKPEGMDKKDWKAQVKEERRTKRETKIPKALKKKYKKKAARGH